MKNKIASDIMIVVVTQYSNSLRYFNFDSITPWMRIVLPLVSNKTLEEKLDESYTKMLYAILKKNWMEHSIKQ